MSTKMKERLHSLSGFDVRTTRLLCRRKWRHPGKEGVGMNHKGERLRESGNIQNQNGKTLYDTPS